MISETGAPPESSDMNLPRGSLHATVTYRPGSPTNPELDGPARLEFRDVPRLGRRFARKIVTTARADKRATLRKLITTHLGRRRMGRPVVAEQWAPYDHVKRPIRLDHWLQQWPHELVGITGFRHAIFGLRRAAPAKRIAFGNRQCLDGQSLGRPGGAQHACVECGIIWSPWTAPDRLFAPIRRPARQPRDSRRVDRRRSGCCRSCVCVNIRGSPSKRMSIAGRSCRFAARCSAPVTAS